MPQKPQLTISAGLAEESKNQTLNLSKLTDQSVKTKGIEMVNVFEQSRIEARKPQLPVTMQSFMNDDEEEPPYQVQKKGY